MIPAPRPIVCRPLFVPKPWGGRKLEALFGKPLPGGQPIGESWELASLPEGESEVRDGELAGTPLATLVDTWGARLTGGAPPVEGRFPLLIKFLDARDHLSVQVHPKPAPDGSDVPGIKHEAWFVLDAEPDAVMFIGLRDGVTADDLRRTANTPEFAELLEKRPARPGDCYMLPSGTVHALGAGVVVAEVQTPSDITYRVYDWNRKGLDGRPRELHIEESLANARLDVREDQIVQPRPQVDGSFDGMTRMAACPRFTMDHVRLGNGGASPAADDCPTPTLFAARATGDMRVWMMLTGRGVVQSDGHECEFSAGDTLLIPAACDHVGVMTQGCTLLEARIPAAT